MESVETGSERRRSGVLGEGSTEGVPHDVFVDSSCRLPVCRAAASAGEYALIVVTRVVGKMNSLSLYGGPKPLSLVEYLAPRVCPAWDYLTPSTTDSRSGSAKCQTLAGRDVLLHTRAPIF